jgi:sugar lactone lactonase YvrE
MKSNALLISTLSCIGAAAMTAVMLGQNPAPASAPSNAAAAAPQQGPGVQAANDARYRDWVTAQCKTPPAPRGAGGGARAGGAGFAPRGPLTHVDYMVTEIPGVIAAGQKWQTVWTGRGNNADGIIASDDGGILAAQNTDSAVMKIDRNGNVSFPYKDTNTGGALAMSKDGSLFVNSRGLPAAVLELAPQRKIFADKYNGEPLDCLGGVLNDLTADSKGGVYFTHGGVYYANPKGVVTKYGTLARVNGIILSPDEKTLYVTGRPGGAAGGAAAAGAGGALGGRGGAGGAGGPGGGCVAGSPVRGSMVAFDVQPDGSLTNERQFASAGNDGSTIDAEGRVYTSACPWIAVIAPDGKLLGTIPVPTNDIISLAFSGPDKKTLYGVANNQQYDEIFKIEMVAQGYKGRAK